MNPTAQPVSRIEVATEQGTMHFRGTRTGRRIVLVILGAFEKEGAFRRVPELMPEFDVLIAHLPGNHCPWLEDMSLAAVTAAFDEAIAKTASDAPILAAGISTGALVALGLKAANVRRLLLIEPPIRPHLAWPLREYQMQGHADRFRLVGPIFGIYADRIEPRDYSDLLHELDRPAQVLMGEVPPAEPFPFTDGLPSLVDAMTRSDLEAHPLVTRRLVRGVGHNIPGRASQVVLDTLRQTAAML